MKVLGGAAAFAALLLSIFGGPPPLPAQVTVPSPQHESVVVNIEVPVRVLKKDAFSVTLDLGLGNGRAEMLTCDFSVDYVKINADYRS